MGGGHPAAVTSPWGPLACRGPGGAAAGPGVCPPGAEDVQPHRSPGRGVHGVCPLHGGPVCDGAAEGKPSPRPRLGGPACPLLGRAALSGALQAAEGGLSDVLSCHVTRHDLEKCRLGTSRWPLGSPPRAGLGAPWPWLPRALRGGVSPPGPRPQMSVEDQLGPGWWWPPEQSHVRAGAVWTPVRGARGAQDAKSQALPPPVSSRSVDPTQPRGAATAGAATAGAETCARRGPGSLPTPACVGARSAPAAPHGPCRSSRARRLLE